MFETKIKIFTKFLLFYLVTELNYYNEEFAIGGRSFQYDVMEIIWSMSKMDQMVNRALTLFSSKSVVRTHLQNVPRW